jgi:uncharacterized protein (UPF0335 family)
MYQCIEEIERFVREDKELNEEFAAFFDDEFSNSV